MMAQLRSDPTKIPQPNRNDMMRMLVESVNSIVNIDIPARYKALWITNKLDGSEDYLVSEQVVTMVGRELIPFREQLISNPSPKTLKDLLKLITPPKGVRRGKTAVDDAPEDEGGELYDCKGEEIPHPIFIDEQFGPENDDEDEQTVERDAASQQTSDQETEAVEQAAEQPEPAKQDQQMPLIELAPHCTDADLRKMPCSLES